MSTEIVIAILSASGIVVAAIIAFITAIVQSKKSSETSAEYERIFNELRISNKEKVEEIEELEKKLSEKDTSRSELILKLKERIYEQDRVVASLTLWGSANYKLAKRCGADPIEYAPPNGDSTPKLKAIS